MTGLLLLLLLFTHVHVLRTFAPPVRKGGYWHVTLGWNLDVTTGQPIRVNPGGGAGARTTSNLEQEIGIFGLKLSLFGAPDTWVCLSTRESHAQPQNRLRTYPVPQKRSVNVNGWDLGATGAAEVFARGAGFGFWVG